MSCGLRIGLSLMCHPQMLPFIRQSISPSVLRSLVKGGGLSIDYTKALGGVTGLFGQVLSSKDDVQIPLPAPERPRIKPEALSDVEIEQAIVPLFDFLDANLSTLNTYLSDATKEMVMTRVWKEILLVVEGLLIPPLSDKPSEMKPLSDKEVDIVFKWLKVGVAGVHAGSGTLTVCLISPVFARLLLR